MTHYHIFLPPPILAPFPFDQSKKADILPLQFRQLSPPRQVDSLDHDDQNSVRQTISQAQGISRDSPGRGSAVPPAKLPNDPASEPGTVKDSNLLKRPHADDQHEVQPAGADAVSAGVHAGHDDSRNTSRMDGLKRARGALRKTQSDVSGPEGSRRRSSRLSRGTASLLASMPMPIQADQTESMLSFNTTLSSMTDPSQSRYYDHSQLPPSADQSTSVHNLPKWTIPLGKLSSLSTLLNTPPRSGSKGWRSVVNLIVCVVSVDEPVLRQRKEEKARRREGTLWIGNWVVLGMPEGGGGNVQGGVEREDGGNRAGGGGEVSCGVKLWETCAREWGDGRVRRGDVVLLENVEYKPPTPKDPPQLSISPNPIIQPRLTVLYRTIPRYSAIHSSDYAYRRAEVGQAHGHERRMEPVDKALRPDLRLGRSDPGVRKVAEVVRWFAEWVGGEV